MMAASSSSAPAAHAQAPDLTCTEGLNLLSDVDIWYASQFFLYAMFDQRVDAVLQPAQVMARLNRRNPPMWDDWNGPESIPAPNGEAFVEADMVHVMTGLIAYSAETRQWQLDTLDTEVHHVESALHMMQALLADIVLEMERRRNQEGRWSHADLPPPLLPPPLAPDVEAPQRVKGPLRVKQAV
jgi:hypothetical protein